ncbi:replicase [Fusarium boothii large flexivirus 1]|nr:replicase [Fusarium boothii large flexivirus 1]
MDCTKCALQLKDSPPFPATSCLIGCVKPVARCLRCIGGPSSPAFDGRACILGCAEQTSSSWPQLLALVAALLCLGGLSWLLLTRRVDVPRTSRWSRFRSRSRDILRASSAAGAAGTATASPAPSPGHAPHQAATNPAPPFPPEQGVFKVHTLPRPHQYQLPGVPLADPTLSLEELLARGAPPPRAHAGAGHAVLMTYTAIIILIFTLAYMRFRLTYRDPARAARLTQPGLALAGTLTVTPTPVGASTTRTRVPLRAPRDCLACWGGPKGAPFPASACLLGCSVPVTPALSCKRCTWDFHTGDATISAGRCVLGCAELTLHPVQCTQCTLGPLSSRPFPADRCVLGCKQAHTPVPASTLTSLPAFLISLCLITVLMVLVYSALCRLMAATRRAVGLLPLQLTRGPIQMLDFDLDSQLSDDDAPTPAPRPKSLMPGRFPVTPCRPHSLSPNLAPERSDHLDVDPVRLDVALTPNGQEPTTIHPTPAALSVALAASQVGAKLRDMNGSPAQDQGRLTPSHGRSPRRFVAKLPQFIFPKSKSGRKKLLPADGTPAKEASSHGPPPVQPAATTFPAPPVATLPFTLYPEASADRELLEALGLAGPGGPCADLPIPPTPPHPDIVQRPRAGSAPASAQDPETNPPTPALELTNPFTNPAEDSLVIAHPQPPRRPLPSELPQDVPAPQDIQLPPSPPPPEAGGPWHDPPPEESSDDSYRTAAAEFSLIRPATPNGAPQLGPHCMAGGRSSGATTPLPPSRAGWVAPKLSLTSPSPEVRQVGFSPATPGAAIKQHLADTLKGGALAADIRSEATDDSPPPPEEYPAGTRARPHVYLDCRAIVPLLPTHLLARNECWRLIPAVLESLEINMLEPFTGPACAACLTRLCGPRHLWGKLEQVPPPIDDLPIDFYHYTPGPSANDTCHVLPLRALVGSDPLLPALTTLALDGTVPARHPPQAPLDLGSLTWRDLSRPPAHLAGLHTQPSVREGPSAYFDHLQDALLLPCAQHDIAGLQRDTPNARVRRNKLLRGLLARDESTLAHLARAPENVQAIHHIATCMRDPAHGQAPPPLPPPPPYSGLRAELPQPSDIRAATSSVAPTTPGIATPTTTEWGSRSSTPLGTEVQIPSGASPHIYPDCPQQYRDLDLEFLLHAECWRQLPGLLAFIHARGLSIPRGALCGQCLNQASASGTVAGSARLVGTLAHGGTSLQLWHARATGDRPSPVPDRALVGITLIEALRGVSGPDQVENRDANTIQQYNEVMQNVRLINPFPMPPEQLQLLQRYGIQENPEPAKSHPHPGNKALENCILYQDVPAALLSLAKPYTLVSVSPTKARRIQTICPGLRHTMNPGVVGKDLLRYGPTARQSTCTKIHTPIAFMHDVLHHLGPLDLITMFEHSPNLQVLLASAVIPVEAVYGAKSLWPGLYTLNYDHRNPGLVTYIPAGANDEPNHGDSYTQPAAAAQWFMHNVLSTIGLNIQMNVVTHRCAHVLFQFTRGSSFVPISRLVIPTPTMSLLPNLTTQSVPWPERIVPTQLYRDLVVWLQTVNLDELKGFDAKYSAILAKATGLTDRATKKHGAEVERAALFLAKVYPFLKTDVGTTELDRLHNVSFRTWLMRLFSETPWLLNMMDIATPTRLRVREAIVAPPGLVLTIDPSPYYVTDIDRATTWITAQLAPASIRDLGLLMEGIVLDQPSPPRLDPNSRASDPVNPDPKHVGWSTGEARPEDTILLSDERLGFYEQETLLANFAQLGCPRVAGRLVLHDVSLPWVTSGEAAKLIRHASIAALSLILLSTAMHLARGPSPAGGLLGWLGRMLFSALPLGPLTSTFFPLATHAQPTPVLPQLTLPEASVALLPYLIPALLLGGPVTTALTGVVASSLACSLDLGRGFCHPMHMLQLAQAELAPSPSWAGSASPHYRPSLVPSANPDDALVHRLVGTLQAWAISPHGPMAGAGLLTENLLHLYVYVSIIGILWYIARPLVALEAAHFLIWVILGSPLGYLTMLPLYLLRRMTPSYAFCSRITQALFPVVYLLRHTELGRLTWRAITLKSRQVLHRHLEPRLVQLAQWLLAGAPLGIWYPEFQRRGTLRLPPAPDVPLFRARFRFLTRLHLLPPHGQQVVQRIIMQLNPSLSRFPHNPVDWLEYNHIYLSTPSRRADDPRAKPKALTAPQAQPGTWDPLGAALLALPNLRSRYQWWTDQLETPFSNSHLAGLLTDSRLNQLVRESWFARSEPSLRKAWPLFTSPLIRQWASNCRQTLETQGSTRHLHALLISEGDPTLASTLLTFGVTVHYQVISQQPPEYPHHSQLHPYHSRPGEALDIPACVGWGLIILDLPRTPPPEAAKHLRASLARAAANTVVVNLHHTLSDPCMSVLAELDQLNRLNPIGRRQGFRLPNGPNHLDGVQLPVIEFGRPPWLPPSHRSLAAIIRRHDFDPASWHLNPPSDLHYGQVSHTTAQVDQILAHLEDRWIRVGLPDPEDAEAEVVNFFAKDPSPHNLGTYANLHTGTPIYGTGLAKFNEVGHPPPTHLWLNVLAPPALGHPIPLTQQPFEQQANPAHLDAPPLWTPSQPWQPNNVVAADSGPYHDYNHVQGKPNSLVAIAHYYMTRAEEYQLAHAALHACRRPADPVEMLTFARRHLLLYVDAPKVPTELMTGTTDAPQPAAVPTARLGAYPHWAARPYGKARSFQSPPLLVPAPPRGPDTCALDTLDEVLDLPRDVIWAVIQRHRHAPALANHDISAAEWAAVLTALGVQCYMHLAEGVEWTGANPVGADGPLYIHALVTHSTAQVGAHARPAMLHISPMAPTAARKTQRERFRECRCCIANQPLAPEPTLKTSDWPTFSPDPRAAQLLAKEIEEGTIGVLDYTDHQPLRRLKVDKPVNLIRSRHKAAGPAVPAQLLLGVPGSAKTTRVVRMLIALHPRARRGDFIAVLPTRNLRDQVYQRYCDAASLSTQQRRDARSYFVTFETALVRTVSATTLYVDELGLYPHGYLDLLLLMANPPTRLIMTGDPSQRRWSPQPARRGGMSPHFLSLEPTINRALGAATLYIGESFRLAEGVATSLGIIPRSGEPGQILYTTTPRNHLPTIVAEADIRRALADFGTRQVYTANNCQGVDISGDYQVQLSSSFAKFTADTWFTLLSRGKRNVYLLAPHYKLPHATGDGAPWLQRIQRAQPSAKGVALSFTTLAAALIETRVPAHLRLALPPNAAPPTATLRGLAHTLATDTARGYTAPNTLAYRRVNQHEGVAGAAGPVHTRVPPRRWLDPPDLESDLESEPPQDPHLSWPPSGPPMTPPPPDVIPRPAPPPARRDWADHSSLATLPGPTNQHHPPHPQSPQGDVGPTTQPHLGPRSLTPDEDVPPNAQGDRLGFIPKAWKPVIKLPKANPSAPAQDRPWPRSAPGLFNRPLDTTLPTKLHPLPLTSLQDEYISAPHEDPVSASALPREQVLLGLHPEAIAPVNPVLTQHEMIGEQVDPILRERWDADMRAYSEQFGIDAIPSEATAFAHHKARDRVTARMTYKRRLNFRPGYKSSTAAHRRAGMLLFTSLVHATDIPSLDFSPTRWERAQRENVYTQLNKPQKVMRERDERFVPEWPLNQSKISVKGQWVKKLPKLNGPAHPGQTIACFRGDYVLRFGVMGRYISSVLEDYMRPEILIYTRLNLEQFNARLRKLWNFGAECEEDDFTAYDESQTTETLEAECMFMRHIGIPEAYIEEYDHLKRCTECQLHAKELDVARFSGEWGTYILNCIINIAYTNLKYDIPRSATQLYSGDDQVCDATRTQRPSWDSISHLFLLQGKPHRTTTPTFCSMAITPAGLIRNPRDLAYRALHGARRGILFKSGPSLALDLGNILTSLPRYAMTLPDAYLQDLATAIQILFRHAASDPLTAQMLKGALPNAERQPTPFGSLPGPVASLVNAHVTDSLDRRAPTLPRVAWAHAPPNIPNMLRWSTPTGPAIPAATRGAPGVLFIHVPPAGQMSQSLPTCRLTTRPAPDLRAAELAPEISPPQRARPSRLRETPPQFQTPAAPVAQAHAPIPGVLTDDATPATAARDLPLPTHPRTTTPPRPGSWAVCSWLTTPADLR